jgi:hypothetical protein
MSFPFLGLAGGIAGAVFFWLAMRRRAQVRAAWAAAKAAGDGAAARPLHASLRVLADVATPLMLFGLLIAGVQVAIAFVITDGGGVFNAIDLAGFLLLLVGYGVWFHTKATYRRDRAPG